MGERRAGGPVAPSCPALDQPVTVEHGMHRADGRAMYVRIEAPKPLADLRCAPAGPLPPQPHDQRLDLDGQLAGLAVWSPGPVRQPVQAAVAVTLQQLVARLARDVELPADRRHRLAVEQAGNELQTFVHQATLLPRHLAILRKEPMCNLCVRNDL